MRVVPLGGLPSEARPQRRAGVDSYSAAEELVLYDGQNHTAISLNLSASAIWDLCDGSNTVQQIIANLAEASGKAIDVIAADVHRALHELYSLNLLVLNDVDADG